MAASTNPNDPTRAGVSAAGSIANSSASARASIAEADSELQRNAKRHLWMHFTRMGSYAHAEVPVIARGEGCYVYDEHGKRYLDGLSALYCVNIGHGRAEIAGAASRQAPEP